MLTITGEPSKGVRGPHLEDWGSIGNGGVRGLLERGHPRRRGRVGPGGDRGWQGHQQRAPAVTQDGRGEDDGAKTPWMPLARLLPKPLW